MAGDDVPTESDSKPKSSMPSENGFSGFVILGAGNMKVKSNTIVGNDLIEVENSTIQSVFSSPNTNDDTHGIFTGEVVYTFANAQTQVYLGSRLEDLLTFDLSQQLGVRKRFDSAGLVSAAVLFSGIPSEVWSDPYLEGVPRSETDRESRGFRLEWGEVLGTALTVQYTRREVDIDKERSGQFLISEGRLTPTEALLLRRDGDDDTLKVNYTIAPNPRHILRPEFGFRRRDRDGDAITSDAFWGQLAYSYVQDQYTLVLTAEAGSIEYDENNPVYGKAMDADWVAFGAAFFYHLTPRWSLVAVGNYADEDSDVDFHDQELQSIIVGVRYRFGQ
jgi:hypothetical protein